MALVVNDPSKPQLTLLEYSREIGPMIRDLLKKKEVLKEFVTENETVDEYKAQVKEVQDEMKKYLADHPDYKDLYEGIAELENDIKQAIKGAERATDKKFPAALLKNYFTARAKETVEKTVEKGTQFTKLTAIIMEPKA
jgi:hypothetical protein